MRRTSWLAAAAVGPLVAGIATTGSAGATSQPIAQATVVSAVPANWTPAVNDGDVRSIVQVGNHMIIGGTFTSVTQAGSSTAVTRNYIFAFDATTGALDTGFLPAVNGEVDTIYPNAAGTAVYVAGRFNTANGLSARLAEFDLATGANVAGFKAPSINGAINDMAVVGSHVIAGGLFTKVAGQDHAGIASFDTTSGKYDGYVNFQLTGHHSYHRLPGGTASQPTGLTNLAVDPAGDRMIIDGNFVNASDGTGNTYLRDQIASVQLTPTAAVIDPNWNTNEYIHGCYNFKYDSYTRAIQWSPDGSYFVVVAGGGYNAGSFYNCDAVSRFESSASGQSVTPTWTDWTGTDSIYSTAVTGTAIYIGGHERWLNNPYAGDQALAGAVPRPGLAAVDPGNGEPLSWNPGRNPRGAGGKIVYATSTGVWFGSDTNIIGQSPKYSRKKLAFFPLAGGKALPAGNTGSLPGTVYLAGLRPSTSTSNVLYRVDAAGPAVQSTDSGPDWAADTDSNPSPLHNAGSNTASYSPSASRGAALPSYVPISLFDTERWDPADNNDMQWTFPVPAGDHLQVNLFFANRYSGTASPGQRVFDVDINGNRVLDHYDIVGDVGNNVATMKSFDVAAAPSSSLTVTFRHEVENPLVNAIEVVDLSKSTPPAGNADGLTAESFDGTTASPVSPNPDSGSIAWSQIRGAFMSDGKVWYAEANGNMYYRTYDGTTFGPEVLVDPYNDPTWSTVKAGTNQTYRGKATGFTSEAANVTGMFWSKGFFYYTLFGDPNLYRRAMSTDTALSPVAGQAVGGVMNPVRQTVSTPGVDWSDAGGMFYANGQIFVGQRSTGTLSAVSFDGTQTTGSLAVVPGAGTGWGSSRGMFLYAP